MKKCISIEIIRVHLVLWLVCLPSLPESGGRESSMRTGAGDAAFVKCEIANSLLLITPTAFMPAITPAYIFVFSTAIQRFL